MSLVFRIIVPLGIAIPFLAILCRSFSPENPTDRRVLVLVDDLAIKSSHSLYFKSLENRGFQLDFKLAGDPKVALHRYGQYLYDALILFSPSIERFGGSINTAAIMDFVDAGHDLILVADESASDLIREVATECGVDFDEDPGAVVIDHINYAVSTTDGDHSLIAADDFIKSSIILGSNTIEAPVLFQGIGQMVNPSNDLHLPQHIQQIQNLSYQILRQSMDLPSLWFQSCRFFRYGLQKAGSPTKHDKSGNEQFLTEISKWVFHERGHLKAVNVRHHRVGEVDEPSMYRINDDLEYSVEIFEWTGANWEPYVADDVQVQFYMMSPYVLKNLSTDLKGVYHTSFKVPDVYGVFQFKIEYQRLGYSSLSLSKQIPVQPFRHNEYERFITAAFPYYGASFSMMAGFLLFTIFYLYNK